MSEQKSSGGDSAAAESKFGGGEGEEEEEVVEVEAVSVQMPRPNLVQRLIEHAFRYLHVGLEGFFNDHVDKFAEDWQQVSQQGHTLEQYEGA